MIPAIPAELDGHLELQRWFSGVRRVATANGGANLADLSFANAFDGPTEAVREVLQTAAANPRPNALQYTPYGGATVPRRLVAKQLAARTGLPFAWRNVVLTPGAMAALNVVLRSVRTGAADEEVVVVSPCWIDVPLYLEHLGFRTRLVPVRADDLRLDLGAIRRALGPKTRAVVLSQPANPTGRLYGAEELAALAGILADAPHPPVLLSDECHRDVVFDGAPFVSPAQFYDATVVVYSFGKGLLIQGQRIGYAAVSPRMADAGGASDRLADWCRIMGFCTPTALMQSALPKLVDMRLDLTRVVERRARAVEVLRGAGYGLVPSDATFFLYPRAPGGDDRAFCEALAEQGVLVMPSSYFHQRGFFRISLTGTDAMVERALSVLAEQGRAA